MTSTALNTYGYILDEYNTPYGPFVNLTSSNLVCDRACVGNMVSRTNSPLLYTSECIGAGASMTLVIYPPNPNENLTLTYYGAEMFATSIGERTFSLTLNGQTWISSVDLLALGDGMPLTAINLVYPANISGTTISLVFGVLNNNPKIGAFSLVSATSATNYATINHRSTLVRMSSSLNTFLNLPYCDVHNILWFTDTTWSSTYALTTVPSGQTIHNTLDPTLFSSDIRCGGTTGTLSIIFPVKGPYTYNVSWSMMEITATGTNQHVVSGYINGVLIFANLDVYAQTGAQYTVYTNSTLVSIASDSTFTFSIVASSGNPCYSLFSLVQVS